MSLIFRQRLLDFTTGIMILNKFIEINTLIKRNLNFKCKVKSHKAHLQDLLQRKVRLQACCNNKILSISFENKAGSEYYPNC